MGNTFAHIKELADTLKKYTDSSIQLMKLNAAERGSDIIANILAKISVVMILLFFLVFVSIVFSFVLGEWMGKKWAGFLVVAVCYFLAGIIIWAAGGRLIRIPIMNALIQQLFKKEEDEEDQ